MSLSSTMKKQTKQGAIPLVSLANNNSNYSPKQLKQRIEAVEDQIEKLKLTIMQRESMFQSEISTYQAAVKKKKIVVPPAKVGILQTKEDMIRKIILKPLSPRKPDVIPGSKQLVKQRDKYGIENIVQQRNRRHILSSLQPLPELLQPVPVETQRSSTSSLCSVRHFTIPRKETLNQIYY